MAATGRGGGGTLTGSIVRLLPAVADALSRGRPVVALESSVLAQGLPIPSNREAASRMARAVERGGALPAITAVVGGIPALGITDVELERFLQRDDVLKVSARDLPVAISRKVDGATTVAGSLCIAGATLTDVFATGGIGGVHRGARFDESADLAELARTSMIVVCAGAKSILDLPATLERLETLGVTVLAYGTNELPGFFTRSTGLRIDARADSPGDVARIHHASRMLGRPQATLVMLPPPESTALPQDLVDSAVTAALAEAVSQGISGSAMTPFLLASVMKATEGESLVANLALLEANAFLAGQIAVAFAELDRPSASGASAP